MKYTFVIIGLSMIAIFSACQQQAPAQEEHAVASDTTPVIADKLPDPVCEMPYDTAYKEWAVYKTDTLHFCSPTCKEVFEKNPEKYMAKLKH